MNPITSIILLMLIVFFVLYKNYSGLMVLILLSLIGNMFYINIYGSQMHIYQLIGFIYIPFLIKNNVLKYLKYFNEFKIEFILLLLLGLVYGFIIPWDDGNNLREWNQDARGKVIITMLKLLAELSLMLFVFLLIVKNKINMLFILKVMSILIIINVLVGIFDYFSGYLIKNILFTNTQGDIAGRIVGLDHEPRSFGRLTSMFVLLLLAHEYKNIRTNYFYLFAILIGFTGIVFSFSLSTFFAMFFSLIYIFYKNFFNKRFALNMFMIILTIGIMYFVSKSSFFQENTSRKFEKITKGDEQYQMWGEPYIFTYFEVFDRAALNFFYNSPEYLFFGVGPNLISIPSSQYLDVNASESTNVLISIPGSGLINILSRSGLLGILLYIMLFRRIIKRLTGKSNYLRLFFGSSFIFFVFIFNPIFYITTAIVLASEIIDKENKKINELQPVDS